MPSFENKANTKETKMGRDRGPGDVECLDPDMAGISNSLEFSDMWTNIFPFGLKKMEKEVDDVLEKIRKFRIEKKISILSLSVNSGISRSHLFYIESKKTVPSLETLAKIAHAMDLQLKDFFL